MVKAFTQNGVKCYEVTKGGKFDLFDSNIIGQFVEFVIISFFKYFIIPEYFIQFESN